MALTNKEKIKELSRHLGSVDAALNFLSDTARTEKEAEQAGHTYKNAKEVEVETDEEEEEDYDTTDVDDIIEFLRENPNLKSLVMNGLAVAMTKKETDPDAEPDSEFEDMPIANLTAKEFAAFAYDVFSDFNNEAVTSKETGLTTTLKETQDKLNAQITQLKEVRIELKQTRADMVRMFGELLGYQPKTNGYRASFAEETVVNQTQKEVAQSDNPIGDFLGGFALNPVG